ncbi:MAG: HD domain-containing protein [Coriobacteriales bacterium]|nr:HD domain-containing protein [Coriobacteriales bacterium]
MAAQQILSTSSGTVNPFAPHLTGVLSAEANAQVAELVSGARKNPYATPNAAAIRRDESDRDRDTVLRPAFVRDAEKIMHMPSYNRLAGKTQVFSFRANDDLTRRGLHVQLVARVARDIGYALGLNLDLIEAIALGHDIGHTPFGHTGERFLNGCFHARTGKWFFHNVQSVRVLDLLNGRNLSMQTLDGVICHNGEFEKQVLRTSDLDNFADFDAMVDDCWARGNAAIGHLAPCTLEGCVVRVSDIIAYVGKDRQDAIRAGIATEQSFDDGLGGAYNAWALKAFVGDVVEHSVGRSQIAMSEEAFEEMRRAKRENYRKIYGAREVNGEFETGMEDLFGELYERVREDLEAGREEAPVFRHHIRYVQQWLGHYGQRYEWERDLDLTVVDYISSMTDDYFMAWAEHLYPQAKSLFPRREHF